MSRFIVTGTGRSGTTYCSAILRICGVKCGHQNVFRHRNALTRTWDWKDYDGDSSFEVVPILGYIKRKEPDTKIVLVKRNLNDTASSMIRCGWFSDEFIKTHVDFMSVVRRFIPSIIDDKTQAERISHYCDSWLDKASEHADLILDLETLDPFKLFKKLGKLDYYDSVLVNAVSKQINSDSS